MIKVLLVEDEPMWQQGIASLLAVHSDITLVGTVDNADDAEVFYEAECPDVFLVDWKIKGPRDGMELAASLSQQVNPHQIILVTGSPVEQIPPHPYGYVPKSKIVTDLVPAIQTASQLS